MSAARADEGLGSIGRDVAQDAVSLVHAEIELAKAQFAQAAKRLIAAAVMLAVAAVLLLMAVIEALGALPSEFGPQLFHNAWLGWLALGGILVLLAALFAVLGYRRIRKSVGEGKDTVKALKEDSEWLKQLSKRRSTGS